jgi:hypothetical protein
MIQQQATQSIVDSITYALSGGKNNNRNIDITAHVKNNLGNAVAGAVVSLRVNKNGVLYQNVNGTTLANGNATMQLSSAPTGCYTSVVQSVTAQGLTWDTVTPTNTICK